MTKLQLVDVSFSGTFHRELKGYLTNFTHEFSFGKAYLLEGSENYKSWILSWLISGKLVPDSGSILLDGVPAKQAIIRDQSWIIRHDEIKKWGHFAQSIRSQVRAGLHSKTGNTISEEEIIKSFKLTLPRYNRKMSQLSSEGWKASSAIGYAHDKRIFCFPDMDYSRPNFFEEYRELWFEDILRFLIVNKKLVIIPSSFSRAVDGLFDEIVKL